MVGRCCISASRPLTVWEFPNPFDTGSARSWTAQELVRYTFAALQAWARERELGRQVGETAQEFAERVAGEVPPLEEGARRLAGLPRFQSEVLARQ